MSADRGRSVDDELAGLLVALKVGEGGSVRRMHLLGGERVLFVVDNVHLAPGHAGHIYDHWRQRNDGSLLLLAARMTWADPYRGFGSVLADLNAAILLILTDWLT